MTGSTHDGRRAAILAIDTATTQVVVATGSPAGRIDGLTTWAAGYRHGETLLPAIGRLLGEQNIRRSRLSGIVVGTGPGAFTGLRVGIATAKGLAHGLGLPIVGISTGEALLAAAGRHEGGRLGGARPAEAAGRGAIDGGPSCCSRPARPTGSSSAPGRRRSCSRPARNQTSPPARSSSPSTSTVAPRTMPSRAARLPAPGSGPRCSGSGQRGSRRATRTTSPGSCPST